MKLNDFLEKTKQYLKIQDELGFIAPRCINITVGKMKQLSELYHTKVKLEYNDDEEFKYNYFYHLYLDGIHFIACSDWQEARNYGFDECDFREEAEIWG